YVIDFCAFLFIFFFSSRRRHTRFSRDWSSDVCSSDLVPILVLVLIATTINYLDRSIFGIARAAGMQSELGLDAVTLGYLGSAFSLTYAFAQIPGGILLDRFGVRFTYAVSLVTWSIFTGMQGFVRSFATLFGYRLGLGL